MSDLLFVSLFVLLLAVYTFICFAGGMLATVDVLRRNDADLYVAWMDRREARREIRKGRR